MEIEMLINTRRRTVAMLFVGMIIVGAASHLSAQTISGKLLDQYSNKPIPNATITLTNDQGAPVGPTVKTGNDGSFSITAPAPGIYRLRANVAGYVTAVSPAIALQPGDRINLNWHLLAGVVSLRPVAIVGNARPNSSALSGFQQRAQRRAFGYFITRDQIDKLRPFAVSDLLRTVPGLEVVPSLRGFGNVVRTIEGCTPAVYLDGVRFPLMGESIDDIANPNELEGIEVYTHAAEVPPEFSGPWSNCGVIALWTRRA
jgi:hypothetical protein